MAGRKPELIMVTREEAIVQIGVDNSQVGPGLTQTNAYLDKFQHKINTKLNKMFIGLVWHEAVLFAAEGIDYLTKKWIDLYYNVDEASTAALSKVNQRWHELTGNAEKAREAAEKALAAFRFLNATDEGKKNTIAEQLADIEKNIEAEKHLLNLRKEGLELAAKGFKLTAEERAPYVMAMVESQTKVRTLEAQRLAIIEKMDVVQDRMNEKAAKEREKIAKDRDEAIKDYQKREEMQRKFTAQAFKESVTASESHRRGLEQFMPTLSEIAQGGGRASGYAQSIEWLGMAAKNQFANFGFEGNGAALVAERNRRYDNLAKQGFVAQRPEVVAEATIKTADILERIAAGEVTVETALTLVND